MILIGDVLEQLATLPDESVHMCVTSPPYWGLRDYGVDGQIGLEPTPEAWLDKMVAVFREVRRVLRDDGRRLRRAGQEIHRHRAEPGVCQDERGADRPRRIPADWHGPLTPRLAWNGVN